MLCFPCLPGHYIYRMKLSKRSLLFITATVLSLLALLPLFGGKHFISLDGSAHVYNAQLMNELLFGDGPDKSLLEFNRFPVPNYSGHIVLQMLLLVFPAFVAEKIFVGLLLLLLPLGAARLIKKSGGNPVLALFFFPLGFSFFVGFGFYNFSVGVIVLLFLLSVIVGIPGSKRIPWLSLFLLWAALYFSHILVFFAGIALTGLFWGIVVWRRTDRFSDTLRSAFVYAAPALPFLILACLFMLGQPSEESMRLPMSDIFGMFVRSEALVAYKRDELDGTYIYSGILLVFLAFTVFFIFRKRVRSRQRIFFAASTILLLALVFLLPDGSKTSGYVTIRLVFLTTLAFLLFVCMLPEMRLQWLLVIPLLACQLLLSVRHYNTNRKLQADLVPAATIGKHIPPGSTAILIDQRDEAAQFWLTEHRYALLARQKDVVVFNNYEPVQSYFPLKWNKDVAFLLFDRFHSRKDHNGTIVELAPDFVVVQKADTKDIPPVLTSAYDSVFGMADYVLYRRR